MEDCVVTANIETPRSDGTSYHGVQVATTDISEKKVTKAMAGHYKKASVPAKYMVKEFPVSSDAHVPVGKQIELLFTQRSNF